MGTNFLPYSGDVHRHRFVSVLAIVLFLFALGGGVGTITLVVNPTAASAQITPLDEETEEAPGLGDITGSPEAGPDPEDAGDRGGFAQLTLAVVLGAAVLFIGSRLVRAAQANQRP